MPLQVPITRTPGTRAEGRREGYQQAAPALDFTPVTNTLREFAKDIEDSKKDMEEFDLQRRFLQETNELTQDFATRQQEAPLGAQGFTDTVLQDYETRHTDLLDEYWEKGYSREGLENLALRLGSLRQGFGERALAFQAQSTAALADKEMSEFDVHLSQYAAANPDGYESAKQEARDAWGRFPGLSAEDRARGEERSFAVIRQGAGKALAIMRPDEVIRLLDPNGLTAPRSATTATGGAYQIIEGLDEDRSTVASTLSAGGLPPQVVAGFLGNFDIEGGYGGAQGDGGSASGIAQWRNERRANFVRMFGTDPHNATKDQQAQFVAWEMEHPEQAFVPKNGLTPEQQRDAILTAPNAEAAAELIDMYYERSSGAHRSQRIAAARKYTSSVQTVDPGASTAEQMPAVPVDNDNQFDIATAQTGNPLLDDLNGAERLQVLAMAREQTNRDTTQVKAAMDVVVRNAQASISTGEYAGPRPTKEEFIQAYGPLVGEQQFAAFTGALQTGQVVQRIKTLNPTEIEAQVALLEPDPASPTYATDVEQYQAAQRAAATIMQQREKDPGAYVFSAFPEVGHALNNARDPAARKAAYAQLERAYERLGIPEDERVAGSDAMIAEIGDRYDRASAEERMSIIESSLEEMGPEMAGRTLGHIPGREVSRDIATYALLRRAPNWRSTFTDVLRGKAIIKEDPARRPSAATINRNFSSSLQGAINNLNPNVSRALNDAAAAIYVQRGGRTDKSADGTELFDPDLYAASLREALGGSATNKFTGIADMSPGGKVTDLTILPPGISSGAFTNWLESLRPGDLTRLNPNRYSPTDSRGRPLTLNTIIDEGVFVMRAPGIYGIKLESDGNWVGDGHGGRFTVDLRTMRPVHRAR